MQKFKKLICSQPRSMMNNLNLLSAKLLVTSGISLGSLFFNPAYSQKTEEYYFGDPNGPKSEIKKINGWETWAELNNQNKYDNWTKKVVYEDGITKWYVVPKINPKVTPPQNKTENYNTKYGTYNTKKEYSDKDGVKRVTNYSNTNKTYTPTYIPPKTKTDLGDVLNTTNAVLNLGLSIANLIENNKKQKNINTNYSAPPVNNPPTNYNSNPEENKKAFDEWLNGKEETENKKAFDEWLNGKELEEALKEQEQKKAEAKLRLEKNSRELSDFVEKQAGVSPETKIWFDKEYKEAEEFYKENCKVYISSCEGLEKADKLSLIIGYNAYKMGKKSQAGIVLEGMEIYKDIEEKGVENYWKEEVKEADEFYKERDSYPKLKVMPDKKELEKILGTEVYAPKIEKDKYSEQINKIAYESDVSKVIRYKAYQYAKNQTEAGEIIEGIEKVEQMKKDNSKFFWDE